MYTRLRLFIRHSLKIAGSGGYLDLGGGLLGAEVPLPQVALHVPRGVLDLGLGPVQALLQLGDARLDHLRCQASVGAGGPPLGLGLRGLRGLSGLSGLGGLRGLRGLGRWVIRLFGLGLG